MNASMEEQLQGVIDKVMREEREGLLRLNEDMENRAILAERVPDLCKQAAEAREQALERWEAQR